jgi:hypothetical protein
MHPVLHENERIEIAMQRMLLWHSMLAIASYKANEPFYDVRTGESGRNGPIRDGTRIIDNVGINRGPLSP